MTVLLVHSFPVFPALDICAVLTRAFHLIGRRGMIMKENIMSCVVTIIFGALIGWTIGITDAFLNTPFNPYSLFITW